jgi:hypothetical protein
MIRWLLMVAAVLAWLFGLMLLFNARAFEAPVGIDVTDKVATIAQAQGAILLGLGVINWLARTVTDVRALTAVLSGNLVVQLLSLGVAGRAVLLHIFPIQGAPAIAIHVVLGVAFAIALARVRHAAAGPAPSAA